MKQYIMENKNKIITYIILVLVISILGYNMYQQDKEIREAKKLLLQEQSKQSNADVISTTILDKKNTIVVTEATIVELETNKQQLELEINCWKNQMNRLVDGLEYNLQYCTDENNLSKFKEGL